MSRRPATHAFGAPQTPAAAPHRRTYGKPVRVNRRGDVWEKALGEKDGVVWRRTVQHDRKRLEEAARNGVHMPVSRAYKGEQSSHPQTGWEIAWMTHLARDVAAECAVEEEACRNLVQVLESKKRDVVNEVRRAVEVTIWANADAARNNK